MRCWQGLIADANQAAKRKPVRAYEVEDQIALAITEETARLLRDLAEIENRLQLVERAIHRSPLDWTKPIRAEPMSVNATLRTAIRCQRPVEMLTAAGRLRQVCPHALGHKDHRLKVLVFQFFGESASGLPSRGAWRSFFLVVPVVRGAPPDRDTRTAACVPSVPARDLPT